MNEPLEEIERLTGTNIMSKIRKFVKLMKESLDNHPEEWEESLDNYAKSPNRCVVHESNLVVFFDPSISDVFIEIKHEEKGFETYLTKKEAEYVIDSLHSLSDKLSDIEDDEICRLFTETYHLGICK